MVRDGILWAGSTRVDQADEEGVLDCVCGVRRRSSSVVFAPIVSFLLLAGGTDFEFMSRLGGMDIVNNTDL